MKHWILAIGLALALAASPAAAQTRVDVVVGLGAPRPFVTGVVLVGRPRPYYSRSVYFHPRPIFVQRVYVVRRHHRHAYRRYHHDW